MPPAAETPNRSRKIVPAVPAAETKMLRAREKPQSRGFLAEDHAGRNTLGEVFLISYLTEPCGACNNCEAVKDQNVFEKKNLTVYPSHGNVMKVV